MSGSYSYDQLALTLMLGQDLVHSNQPYVAMGFTLELSTVGVGASMAPSNFFGGGMTQYYDATLKLDATEK